MSFTRQPVAVPNPCTPATTEAEMSGMDERVPKPGEGAGRADGEDIATGADRVLGR